MHIVKDYTTEGCIAQGIAVLFKEEITENFDKQLIVLRTLTPPSQISNVWLQCSQNLYEVVFEFLNLLRFHNTFCLPIDGAIGQGEICNSKVKNFQNPYCPILEKIK